MRVTALRLQSRNKTRVNVYLDGEFAFGLTKIIAIRLKIGQVLDEAAVAQLQEADAEEQAHERALKLLSSRPRSESEIRQRLSGPEVPEARVTAVITRLKSAGLVNDEAFANFWVENRNTFRPRSKRALQMELKRKGVTGATLDQALTETDDAQAARQLATQRAKRLSQYLWPEFRQKLGDYLLRRGFDYETVATVVRQAWEATHATPAEADLE